MLLAVILPRGDQLYVLRKPLIRRDKEDTHYLLVQFLLEPWVSCTRSPASLLFSRLSGLAASGPTLSCLHVFFPHMASTTLVWFLALLRLPSAFPNPILVPVPPLLLTFPSPLPSRSYPVLVHRSPLLSPVPFPPHHRSRPRSRFALLRSPPPPFLLLLCPRPRPQFRAHLRSRPRLRSRIRPRSLFPVPRTQIPPRYDACVQAPDLANGAVRCPQALPSACIDDDACGIKVPHRVYSSCVCVCVCIFIKLHITAQSGLVILVILCHSH